MKNMIYLLSLCITILASCDPDEPCPTCFEDIVRCKVNGKDWVSNCKSTTPLFGCSSVRCYHSYNQEKGLDFFAVNDRDNSGIILDQFSAYGGLQIGNNTIQQKELRYKNFKLGGNCPSFDSTDLSYNNSFEIITLDTVHFFIEGKFQFKIYNKCGDTITITDGYFKTKFNF